ncbi:Cell cycle checkpoint protein rad17 [Blyttiomyces sp. JEL0837]|nr:Cell cycle checkpoint protein rad17 [Blyttiomyces sp. JEL0837]
MININKIIAYSTGLIVAFSGALVSGSTTPSPYTAITNKGENHEVTQFHWPWTPAPNVNLTENVNVFVPSGDSGKSSYPVVFFYGGFGSNLPSAAYSDLLSQISSKADGAIIVAWDALFTNPVNVTNALTKSHDIYNWATTQGSLQKTINNQFTHKPTADTSRIFFAGHSSGNQIAVKMAETYPVGVKGLILLDPVDSDPFKLTSPVIPLNGTVGMTVPVVVVASELCEIAGIPIVKFPACCPSGYDNFHFYNAFQNAAKFDLVAKYYGHADLLDDLIAEGAHISHFCATVSDTNAHPFSGYKNLVSGAVSSFISVFGYGNCQYASYLTDSTTFNTPADLKTDNIYLKLNTRWIHPRKNPPGALQVSETGDRGFSRSRLRLRVGVWGETGLSNSIAKSIKERSMHRYTMRSHIISFLTLVAVGLTHAASVIQVPVTSPYNTITNYGENHEATELHWPWLPAPNVNLTENVFVPDSSLTAKSFPVVFFYGGFGSNAPSIAYNEVLHQISSKADGAIIVAWDALFTNPVNITNALNKAYDIYNWATTQGSLQKFINNKFSHKPLIDTSRIFFAAHSSGNQIAVKMAETYPVGVKGLILLDPVDSDPFKFTAPVIPLNTTVDLVVPVVVIASELCEQAGIPIDKFPACCPAGYDNLHFYNAFLNAPKFDIVAQYYGHADILDDLLAGGVHVVHFCTSVADTKAHPYSAYRNLISGAVSAFISVFADGNCQYAQYLTDSSKFNTPATLVTENRSSSSQPLSQSSLSKWTIPNLVIGKRQAVDEPPHTRSSYIADTHLWIDKHAPVCEDEIAIHKKKIADVRGWLSSALESARGPGLLPTNQRILVLSGPAGAGKTALIRLLAMELDYDIQEWVNPFNTNEMKSFSTTDSKEDYHDFVSLGRQFTEFLGTARKSSSLTFSTPSNEPIEPIIQPSSQQPNRSTIILIEDFPNLYHFDTRKTFHTALRDHLFSGRTMCPLVIVLSNVVAVREKGQVDNAICFKTVVPDDLEPYVAHIMFNPIAPTIMRKALNRVLDLECSQSTQYHKPSKAQVDAVIESSGGDIRCALNALQFLAIGGVGGLSAGGGEGGKGKKKKVKKDVGGEEGNDGKERRSDGIGSREVSLNLFHALGKVLMSKRVQTEGEQDFFPGKVDDLEKIEDVDCDYELPLHLSDQARLPLKSNPEAVFEASHVDADTFAAFLSQNYTHYLTDIEECVVASEMLSTADTLSGVWATRASMSDYTASIATRGVMLSRITELPTNHFRQLQKITAPQVFYVQRTAQARLKLVGSSRRRWLDVEVSEGDLGRRRAGFRLSHMHSSKDMTLSILPFMSRLLSFSGNSTIYGFQYHDRQVVNEVGAMPRHYQSLLPSNEVTDFDAGLEDDEAVEVQSGVQNESVEMVDGNVSVEGLGEVLENGGLIEDDIEECY